DRELDGRSVAVRGDRPRARRQLAEVDQGGLQLGDVDARHITPTRTLDHGELDGAGRLVLVDLDRVERVARRDTAPPAQLGGGALVVGRGAHELDAHGMLVDEPGSRADEGGLADDRVDGRPADGAATTDGA